MDGFNEFIVLGFGSSMIDVLGGQRLIGGVAGLLVVVVVIMFEVR